MDIHFLHDSQQHADPLDVIENMAARSQMNTERIDQTELHLNIGGIWRDIAVWFAWREDMRVLQLGAPLELKIPADKYMDICKLLAIVNERVWLGHFDVWSEDNGLIYRNATVLSEAASFDSMQAEILVRGAAEAFERFFPAFNYVLWGNKCPEEALEFSMFEVAGTA